MNGGDLNQQQMMMQRWYAMQQQQHWMGMQYQQPMMYGGGLHYVPYYHGMHHQLQPPYGTQPQRQNQIQSSVEENGTLWIGDLQPWMNEGYLQSCFAQTGEVISVKIIRNKQTGQSERYGFIEFNSHSMAENVLQSYNGIKMPDADQSFRLNWAAFSSGDRRPEAGSDLSIYVADLAAEVTDTILLDTFTSRYPSVKGAKVVIDSNTGCSKGYGFVRFDDENEKNRAMSEMNGENCSGRPMRISVATPKKFLQFSSQGHSANGPSNTTIFVGGLDAEVTDDELKAPFAPFGEVVSVKIPNGKGCGFVQFANRNSAEEAIERLNGSIIGNQTVRLSWGRNLGNRQVKYSGDAATSNGHVSHEQLLASQD